MSIDARLSNSRPAFMVVRTRLKVEDSLEPAARMTPRTAMSIGASRETLNTESARPQGLLVSTTMLRHTVQSRALSGGREMECGPSGTSEVGGLCGVVVGWWAGGGASSLMSRPARMSGRLPPRRELV